MKRLLVTLLLATVIFACVHKIGPVTLPTGVVVIEAQSLPVTKHFAWNASTNADDYVATLDGVNIGTTTGLVVPFTITTLGSHTLTVTARNIWGTSAPAQLVVVVQLPSNPGGLAVTP